MLGIIPMYPVDFSREGAMNDRKEEMLPPTGEKGPEGRRVRPDMHGSFA